MESGPHKESKSRIERIRPGSGWRPAPRARDCLSRACGTGSEKQRDHFLLDPAAGMLPGWGLQWSPNRAATEENTEEGREGPWELGAGEGVVQLGALTARPWPGGCAQGSW